MPNAVRATGGPGLLAVIAATAAFALFSAKNVSTDYATIVSNHLMTALPLVAAVASFFVARKESGATRRAWQFLCAWGVLSGSGNFIWSLHELVWHDDPFPSLADAGYLGGNICAIVAIALFAAPSKRSSRALNVLDGAIIAGSVFILSWDLVLHTVYESSAEATVAAVIGLAYPVIDIVIVALIVFVVSRGHAGIRSSSVMIIGLGFIGWAVADSGFAYLTTIGTYRGGHPIDAGWLGGDALIVLASLRALRQRAPSAEEVDERPVIAWRAYLPYAAAGFATVVVAAHQILGNRIDISSLVVITILLCLVVGRQFLMVYENQSVTISRLRSLDEMKNGILRAVSHELRTPLTYIKGAAVFLTDEGEDLDPSTRKDMLDRLVVNADRLEMLLSGLLDLERLARGVIAPERQRVDVLGLVMCVVETMDVRVEVRGKPTDAFVDPGQVERIVENLLVNAVRHTPDGAKIRASVARVGEGVEIVVSDNGPGVPDDMKERVFEPFVQTEATVAAGKGTGIGLSLVAKFAELHGGRVWITDSPLGGASFHVLLTDHHISSPEREDTLEHEVSELVA